MLKRFYSLLFVLTLMTGWVSAQISKKGYSLVYSSETPEVASAKLSLTEEELKNCTGDFASIENLERNWDYSRKASSEWNKRMGVNAEERALVHKTKDGHLRMLAVSKDGTAGGFVTSGVNMKKGFKYGIFEIKAKCNPHASNFPAIWMMPVNQADGWPNCGEIDIMEMIGTSSTVWSTVHLGARYDKPVGRQYAYSGNRWFNDGYHIYSLLWTKNSLTFYTDGVQVFRYNKDETLDLVAHPDYEKWQFPYNKEFYIILDQALGKNSSWGSENPDPTFTYEMDVEYVRIWQAAETYEVDDYYLLRNYADPTRFMMVGADNTLTTTEITEADQLTDDMMFGVAQTDVAGKYYLRARSGLLVAYVAEANKAVPMANEGRALYLIKNAKKGVAFDFSASTAPTTYANGSRALTLNANRDNIVSVSGTSKDAAWWTMVEPEAFITGIQSPTSDVRAPRKVIRDGRLLIMYGDKAYTTDGLLWRK